MIHSCSYYCDKSECIKAQRDELRDKLYKRQWVGLTDADYEIRVSEDWKDGMSYADGKLKEKNT